MTETDFKLWVRHQIENNYPDAIVTKLDPFDIQGIPDMVIFYGPKYAVLEGKISRNAKRQPNQGYYVSKFDNMSFSRFIYPENAEQVLEELFYFLDD